MREGFGDDITLCRLLQAVVADSGGSAHRFFDVALFQHVLLILGVHGPDACQAIGLKFQPYGQSVAFLFTCLLTRRLDLCRGAKQRLNVMTHFMRYDVGECEVAAGAELACHLVVEREVEVDLLVARTIERPRCTLRDAAIGLHDAGEQHERGFLVCLAGGFENFRPDVAQAFAFLLSSHAAHITGQVIRVDGGQAVLRPLPRATT